MQIEHCGTRACVAGLAAIMFGDDLDMSTIESGNDTYWSLGKHLLGLSDTVADQLFTPVVDNDNPKASINPWPGIDAEQIAGTLRHLADTGEVHWFANCTCADCDPNGQVTLCEFCSCAMDADGVCDFCTYEDCCPTVLTA